MRDKIQKIVVQAVAGTKDLTEAIDELCVLSDVVVSSSLKMDRNRIWEQLLVEENDTAFSSKIEAYTDDVYLVIFKDGEIKP